MFEFQMRMNSFVSTCMLHAIFGKHILKNDVFYLEFRGNWRSRLFIC